jgi:diguanylate cyclase (GGDEF)-like protein
MATKPNTNSQNSAPLRGPLLSLVAAGFMAGLFLVAGFWLLNAGLGMAGSLFTVILVFLSITCLLIAVRIYAHISLNMAQNDQKHLQNALIQAKDMLDSSKQLRDEHVLLQTLTQNLPFPAWLKDRFGRYLVANQAFVKQWCNGVDPKGKTDAELLNAKLVETFALEDQKALSSRKVQKMEMRFDFSDKAAQWVRIERYPLEGDDQQPVGVLGFAIDISSYKNDQISESDLLKDPVTQFFNLAGLTRYISENPTANDSLYCVHIDIDHFKVLNDSLGQQCGDQLLEQVAQRILLASTKGEVLARTNADEFVLFVSSPAQEALQSRLDALHQALSEPISIGEQQYSFTTSMGVAKALEHGETLEVLKQNADVALFNAKKLGRNQIHWYQSRYQDQALRRLNKEQVLRSAISEDRLRIEVQPRINSQSNEIEALECLVRIELDDGNLMYPNSFIALAEQNGLIRAIDSYMLEQALTQIEQWLNDGVTPLTLAINLSLQSFNEELSVRLSSWQHRRPEVLEYLELELTEHRLPKNDATFLERLITLRDMGIKLALDDFGTGYANLSRLPDWPFQILKLDRTFIADLPTSEKQQTVVKSIIDLCNSLDIHVVAEGVETETELTLVDSLGCRSIQGFLYAKPKPIADIDGWLVQRKISLQ